MDVTATSAFASQAVALQGRQQMALQAIKAATEQQQAVAQLVASAQGTPMPTGGSSSGLGQVLDITV